MVGYAINGEPGHTALGLRAEQLEPWNVDTVNALVLRASADRSLAEVKAAYDRTHAEARAAVEGINWAEWNVQIQQGGDGPPEPRLGWIAGNTYEHYIEHWHWLPVA